MNNSNNTNNTTVNHKIPHATRRGKIPCRFLQVMVIGNWVDLQTGETQFTNWTEFIHLPVDTEIFNYPRLCEAVDKEIISMGYDPIEIGIYRIQWISPEGDHYQIKLDYGWMSTIQKGWD